MFSIPALLSQPMFVDATRAANDALWRSPTPNPAHPTSKLHASATQQATQTAPFDPLTSFRAHTLATMAPSQSLVVSVQNKIMVVLD